MKQHKKLILGIIKRLIYLLEESEELFFYERPYLIRKGEKAPKDAYEKTRQNDLEITQVKTALSKAVAVALSDKEQTAHQERLIG